MFNIRVCLTLLTISSFIVLFGCKTVEREHYEGILTPTQVEEQRHELQDHIITVSGYLLYRPEGKFYSLYDVILSDDRDNAVKCLVYGYALSIDDDLPAKFQNYTRRKVIVTGVFKNGRVGGFNLHDASSLKFLDNGPLINPKVVEVFDEYCVN